MKISNEWNKLHEEHELAYFKADVCLGSPQSFSPKEKREICEQMEATTYSIDTALREDFEALPPKAQDMLLELFCASGYMTPKWWKSTLPGPSARQSPHAAPRRILRSWQHQPPAAQAPQSSRCARRWPSPNPRRSPAAALPALARAQGLPELAALPASLRHVHHLPCRPAFLCVADKSNRPLNLLQG